MTRAQNRALADAAEGTLIRFRGGWVRRGGKRPHSPQVIDALRRRGLLLVDPMGGCKGTARLTPAGRSRLAGMEKTK